MLTTLRTGTVRSRIVTAVAGLATCAAITVATPATADAAISNCYLANLPVQASQTVDLIHSGGPFPYPKNDGVVFSNREGVLPSQSSSYYHEYTVPTPGASTRGARRIVTGGTPLTSPPHYYYTGDHYGSFCEIVDA